MPRGKGVKQQKNNSRSKSRGKSGAKSKPKKSATKRKLPARLEKHKWKPGQSGNPNGRPTNALSLTHLLRKHLERPAADFEHVCRIADKLGLSIHEHTVGEVLVAAAAMHAIISDRGAHLSLILDRIDGSVKAGVGKSSEEQARDVREFLVEAEATVEVGT